MLELCRIGVLRVVVSWRATTAIVGFAIVVLLTVPWRCAPPEPEPSLGRSLGREQDRERLTPGGAITNTLGMHLVLIPGGEFIMGSGDDQHERDWRREPQHSVVISRPFYMASREVTNGVFRRFEPGHLSGDVGGESLDQDGQPVVNVPWSMAVRFCEWLSAKELGRRYRLPTEAEWEYACRAGSSTRWYWGGEISDIPKYANLRDLAARRVLKLDGGFDIDDGAAVAARVASYAPNPWGLYDMIGNVSEWCQDRYGAYDASSMAVDPQGPLEGESHVVRGGSWGTRVSLGRAAAREASVDGANDIGIRVVLEVKAIR